VFQTLYCCSKYNLTSSIEWHYQISYSSSYSPRNPKRLSFSLVIPPPLRLGACSKRSIPVPSTTRRALSHYMIRLIAPKTIYPKYSYKVSDHKSQFRYSIFMRDSSRKIFRKNLCLSKLYYKDSEKSLFREFFVVFCARDIKVCFCYRLKVKYRIISHNRFELSRLRKASSY
jgi:hypothetical protein